MDIKVIREGKTLIFRGEKGVSLLEQMKKQNIYISAACGGMGKCGKCKVLMTDGATEPSESDRRCFSKEEQKQGWRLACTSFPSESCTVVIYSDDESQFEIIGEYSKERQIEILTEEEYVIGIDLGTTTIVLELVERTGRQSIYVVTSVNRQRAFGADVISRMKASNEGQLDALKQCIRKELYEGIKRLIHESGIDSRKISGIAMAGNTTMGHLLMGYSCETLGVYPFTPVNIGTIVLDFEELFWQQQEADGEKALKLDTQITLLPGISTYIGGDISSGMLACNIDRQENPCLFIDLGTNGEMAIGNRDRILVTSAAAGPAFEGGNISRGMGSVPGAICNVVIKEEGIQLKTIGDRPPVGLCGTGVIETVYELRKEKMIDETGMMPEPYFSDGYELAKTPWGDSIAILQKDIREIQLAKSAIRAGVETLLRQYGVSYDKVEQVFLAGGFGYHMNPEKAIGIGMLPEEFRGKITTIGNTSLKGTVLYQTRKDAKQRLDKIINLSKEVELASDMDFAHFYTKYMFFDV